jgi:hypothetical protein
MLKEAQGWVWGKCPVRASRDARKVVKGKETACTLRIFGEEYKLRNSNTIKYLLFSHPGIVLS